MFIKLYLNNNNNDKDSSLILNNVKSNLMEGKKN